ncbi:MAG: PilZ domain-containing protein [gamma proteobacterium endosymbiont of Lamellibrachia anaximandri]|nr:PilZ domain-containing protein [gamma proteobacterium endosymbiont of Lamellibrachia anaximandri]
MFQIFSRPNDSMRRPKFTVPAPDTIENPHVETHPGSLRQWIASLPYASPARVAEAITTNLAQLNRFPGRVTDRIELMELYRLPTTRLCRIASNKPGAPSVEQIRQLMQEMAYGHKHIVNECLRQKSWLKHRKRLLGGIYYAIKFLSLDQLTTFEGYDCQGTNAWREILQLYNLAEQQNQQHDLVDDRDQAEPKNASVAHQLKRILLLALLDPCHLKAGEARLCYGYLNQFAGKARFEELKLEADPAGRYIIDMMGEVPPRLFDPDTSGTLASPRFRLLNINPVSKRLHQSLRKIELRGEAPPMGLQHLSSEDAAGTLRDMLKSWHIRVERNSKRQDTYGQVTVAIGISSIHHFLGIATPAVSRPDEEEGESVTLASGNLGGGFKPRHQRFTCKLTNCSKTGVAIHLPLQSSSLKMVGQLVLITEKHPDQPDSLKIGEVRRALKRGSDMLELGIQFLKGHVMPVTLNPIGGSGGDLRTQPCLYVDRGVPKKNTLLSTKGQLKTGREYLVAEQIPAPVIVPTEQASSSPYYERLKFRYK